MLLSGCSTKKNTLPEDSSIRSEPAISAAGNSTSYELEFTAIAAEHIRDSGAVTSSDNHSRTGPDANCKPSRTKPNGSKTTLMRGDSDDDTPPPSKHPIAKAKKKENSASPKSKQETYKFNINDKTYLLFTVDSAMKIGQTYDAILSIYTEAKDSVKAQQIFDKRDTSAKQKIKDSLFYIPDYKATLHGNNFKVMNVTDSVQHLYRHSVTTWNWQVEPQEGGLQKLTVVVAGFNAADESHTPKDHFFIRHIQVNVGGIYLVREFATTQYAYTLYTSVLGFGIWYLQNRRKKRKHKYTQAHTEHKATP